MRIEKSRFNSEASTQPVASQKEIFKAEESDISVIKFEGYTVRIVNVYGEPWFVVSDVCQALEISNPTSAVSSLDCDEVMTLTLTEGHSGKRGGARSWNMAAESGFYKLIARSRKASTSGTFAHRFSNWVFRDVIGFDQTPMRCELSPAVIRPHFTARIILGYMRLLTEIDGYRR